MTRKISQPIAPYYQLMPILSCNGFRNEDIPNASVEFKKLDTLQRQRNLYLLVVILDRTALSDVYANGLYTMHIIRLVTPALIPSQSWCLLAVYLQTLTTRETLLDFSKCISFYLAGLLAWI